MSQASSYESEDSESDNYEQDDFLVGDDVEESEEEVPILPAKRERRNKRLKRKIDLEDDFRLIQENAGQDLSQSESDYDIMEFDDDYRQQHKGYMHTAAQIFGQQPEFEEPETQIVDFDPSDKKEQYATEEDLEVWQEDIPERLNYKFKDRLNPEENELEKEAEWMAQSIEGDSNELIEKIQKFLKIYRMSKTEVAYIATYQIQQLRPELQQEDLWRLERCDNQWSFIHNSKQNLTEQLGFAGVNQNRLKEEEDLGPGDRVMVYDVVLPDCVVELLEKSSWDYYKIEIEDLKKYLSTYTYIYRKNVLQLDYLQRARVFKIGNLIAQGCLSPAQICENLNESQFKHNVPSISTSPQDFAFDLLCSEYKTQEQIIIGAIHLAFQELVSYPEFRKIIRKEYFEHARIFTFPTDKGKEILDVLHPYYRTKSLNGKTIWSFYEQKDQFWSEIMLCKQQGLINVETRLSWKNWEDDRIFAKVKKYYTLKNPQSQSDQEWNDIRKKIIQRSLNECYKEFEIEQYSQLSEQSQQYLLSQCMDRFRQIIERQPYKPGDQLSAVLVVVPSTRTHYQATFVILDGVGNVTSCLDIISGFNPQEIQNVQYFILEHQPEVILIAANCLNSIYIRRNLKDWLEQITYDKYQEGSLQITDMSKLLREAPMIVMESDEVAKLNADSHNYRSRLKENSPLQRIAISLGRYFLNACAETLNLWMDPNEVKIAKLRLHPLQDQINSYQLLQAIEQVAVQYISLRGVDINQVIKHEHLISLLAFVPGLGRVKAYNLVQAIRTKLKGQLKMRAELYTKKLLKPVVFENCAGFLKIPFENLKSDPLDSTRVHPADYPHAIKIAESVFESNFNNLDKSYMVQKVMENPAMLDDLDINGYVEILKQQEGINIEFTLNFIIQELQKPFYVPSQEFQQHPPIEIFYMVTGENRQTLFKGSIVQMKIKKYEGNTFRGELESGAYAVSQIDEDEYNLYKIGAVYPARVLDIQCSNKLDQLFFTVNVSLKEQDVFDHKRFVQVNTDDAFTQEAYDWDLRRQLEDENQQCQQRYLPRLVNNVLFRNIRYSQVLEELRNKQIGECIFRPAPKVEDRIYCSWKFYDNTFAHLVIQEKDKPNPQSLGRYFELDNDVYCSLKEIVDTYIQPCNKLVKEALIHTKFKFAQSFTISEVSNIIKAEKQANAETIPYYLTIDKSYPQYLILCYMPKSKIINEYIKVKPKGYFFHENYFSSINQLIAWFKRHYNDRVYLKQLQSTNPPSFEQSEIDFKPVVRQQRIGKFKDEEFDSFIGGTPRYQTPRYGSNAWDNAIKGTPRADINNFMEDPNATPFIEPKAPQKETKNVKEITCNKCKKTGHIARNCNAQDERKCYNCGEGGHFANRCPQPRKQRERKEEEVPADSWGSSSAWD